jgi:ABC-2 type transport system permease protein
MSRVHHPFNGVRLSWLFFRVGAMNELQYRANFFLQLVQSLLALGTGLVTLALVFSHTDTLNGWTRPQLLVVMGVFTIMGGIIQTTIQPNMERLMQDVRMGTFDYVLVKPEDAQLLVSVREVRIWQSIDIVTGAVVAIAGLTRVEQSIGIWDALGFAFLLVLGAVMIYCFLLMLTSGAFWFVRMDEIQELFQGVSRAGQYPVGVYPGWLRIGLTFLVPLAFAITVPAEALTGRLTWTTVVGAIALATALFAITRWLWRRGLARYGGASS